MKTRWMGALSLALLLLSAQTSLAYFSMVETGEIPAPGTYEIRLEPQLVFNNIDDNETGLNLVGHFDAPVSDASSIRATLGVGITDFQTGFSYKWIPVPDIDNQPAIGFKVGVLYARVDKTTQLSARFTPMASKKYDTDYGLFIPYVGMPMGITSVEKESYTPINLAFGSEYKPVDLKYVWFGTEVGIDLKDSFSYISGVMILSIDEDEGVRFE